MCGRRWCEDCVYWCKVQRSSSSLIDAGPHITSHHSFLCLLFIFMFTLLVPTELIQSSVFFVLCSDFFVFENRVLSTH